MNHNILLVKLTSECQDSGLVAGTGNDAGVSGIGWRKCGQLCKEGRKALLCTSTGTFGPAALMTPPPSLHSCLGGPWSECSISENMDFWSVFPFSPSSPMVGG